MNILHIIDEPWDSGISHYAVHLALGLARKGHKIIIAARRGAPAYYTAKASGFPVINARNMASLYWCVVRERIELINAHTGAGHTKAALLDLLQNIPVVRTRGDVRTIKSKPLGKWLYNRTSKIITPSENLRCEVLRVYHLPHNKVVTVYQGIEAPSPFLLPEGQGKGEGGKGGSEGRQIVSIVARLDPVKGHRDFLDAASRVIKELPDVKFVIAGKQANITFTELDRMCMFFGIHNAVEIKGFVPDVIPVMRESTIGVISSTGSESVSRVCLEWMAQGKPVVATKVGCIPELIDDGATGFIVPSGDPEQMSKAIISILKDTTLAQRLGENARQKVKQDFSLERFTNQTEEIYKEVLCE